MKLQKWMEFEGASTDEISELLRISRSQVHKYLYENAIPKPNMMQKIFVMTRGMVCSDDFNNLSEKLFDDANLQKFIYNNKNKKPNFQRGSPANFAQKLHSNSFRY